MMCRVSLFGGKLNSLSISGEAARPDFQGPRPERVVGESLKSTTEFFLVFDRFAGSLFPPSFPMSAPTSCPLGFSSFSANPAFFRPAFLPSFRVRFVGNFALKSTIVNISFHATHLSETQFDRGMIFFLSSDAAFALFSQFSVTQVAPCSFLTPFF